MLEKIGMAIDKARKTIPRGWEMRISISNDDIYVEGIAPDYRSNGGSCDIEDLAVRIENILEVISSEGNKCLVIR